MTAGTSAGTRAQAATGTRALRSVAAGLALALAAAPAVAQAPSGAAAPEAQRARSLDELLRLVQEGWERERRENVAREQEFARRKQEQERLLREARGELEALEARSEELETAFEQNEIRVAEQEELLRDRLGTMGELFGVVRQVAGDTASVLESSLTSAQFDGRVEPLVELGKSKALPSIEKLEGLWYALVQEMAESGKVVRFPATVVTATGDEVERDVARAGVFNAVADGKYLNWDPRVGKLQELPRQPASRYLATVDDFLHSTDGDASLAIDPSRGQILQALVDTPSGEERIQQGGPVGYTIIALGVAAALLGIARLAWIFLVSRRVAAQRKRDAPDPGNPLGRVLQVFDHNRHADAETLELKLDEAILRESSRLERFVWLVKVVSVVAPLLGLLGTVTGMIQTFQAITLFGTGDPRMMASGISEALVTTMLGLCVAIPLTLLYSFMSSVSKGVVGVLHEESAGMVALRAEKEMA